MIFFIIAFSIHTLINSYVFYRGWQALPQSLPIKTIYITVFLVLYLSFIIAMLGRHTIDLSIQKVLYFIGTTWLAAMLYLSLFFLITDLIHVLDHYFHFLPQSIYPKIFHQIQVIAGYAIVAVILGVGHYKFNHPTVVEKEIVIHKNGGKQKELRVVAFSDLHLGITVNKARLKKYVELINQQNPDVILISGDLVDNSLRILNEENLNEELNQLKAPLGIYFCLGNHEYISGINECLDFFDKTQIQVLVDEATLVDNRFWVIGRNDLSAQQRLPLCDLVAMTDSEQALFLLDHQPYHLEEAEANGIDFQFSGHTHHGQLWPFSLLTKKIYEVPHGYKKKGHTHIYVSSGLALWGPEFRVGTQSEMLVLTVRFEE